MKALRLTFAACSLATFALISGSATAQSVAASQTPQPTASAQIDHRDPHIHGGSEIAFRVKLDRPLPSGAYFRVQLSPVAVTQEIAVGSGEPVDHDRREFVLKTKLPDEVTPGPWHIAEVYVFMPGSSWTTSTIAVNDLRFDVEGKPIDLPKSATVAIESNNRQ